ncbi:TPA: cytochrome b/b6 domain-containing protein [Neisseria meningitidis]|nr:prokaryotic cytochrome b561 family protein [Neisseria meningitidis 98080]RQL28346.1 cytochrome B [Neisseria meningitidis]
MKPDTLQSYGSTTRFLHWTIAACYLFMFATVIAWNIDENLKFLINSHKAVGILLLILSVWRVATVFFTPSGKNTKTQIKPSGYRFRRYRFRQNNHASGHSISSAVCAYMP